MLGDPVVIELGGDAKLLGDVGLTDPFGVGADNVEGGELEILEEVLGCFAWWW